MIAPPYGMWVISAVQGRMAAGLFWMFDCIGAALFAWGVANAVATLAAGGAVGAATAGLILGGALVRLGCQFSAQVLAARAGQRAARNRRISVYPILFGANAVSSGATATIIIDHIAAIESRVSRFEPVRGAAVIAPVGVAAIVAVASWVSALILLATLVPFALAMILAGSAARQASDRQIAAITTLSDLYVDRLHNLPIIRHFGAGERIARQATQAAQDVAARTMTVLRAAFLSSAVLEFFAALSVALVAVYCGFSLLGMLPFAAPEALDLRAAFFGLAMAPEFYLPMRRLAAAYHERQLGDAAERAIDALPVVLPRSAPAARVAMTDVVIDWPGRRVGPVSLAIGGCGLIAITGPTGSGKTSLLAALAGQIDPTAGRIETMRADDIAWAAQVPLLLPGSLLDNLRIARPGAPIDDVMATIAAVGLEQLIGSRPDGIHTPVDHHAAWLSGGERRRIGLARALIAGRPLMLCDEPTADLDAASADAIVSLLRLQAAHRAVIVATHDARLTAVADQVVAL